MRIMTATILTLGFLLQPLAAVEWADHWAFLPIADPLPPKIHETSIQTPVDAFIREQQEARGLKSSPPSSRKDFVRRTYNVLTGLPPSFELLTEWIADTRTDDVVVSELVDTLLASPAYGVRWGRYWLDLARYSDTKGYAYAVEQFDFYHAWRYRDWVVAALNADLPYDQFIARQIAADRLLEKGACETGDLAAMAFLTAGRRFLGVEQDIIDDRIDVVTRGILGLTAACARCHDHKFDPIPTADYYALYGIFKSSREKLLPLEKNAADPELSKLFEAFTELFNKEADTAERSFLERVDEYLIAALDLSTVPPPAFSEIVVADAVVPAQIRRWHEYLSRSCRESDPVFAPWKALEKSPAHASDTLQALSEFANSIVIERLQGESLTSMREVALCYASLFRDAAKPESIGAVWEEIRQVIQAPDSPLIIARDHPHDVEWLFTNGPQSAIKKAFASYERRLFALREHAAYTVALVDRAVPQNMPILNRGDYLNQGMEVPRANLSALEANDTIIQGSGRLELARSLTNPKNPLTARVIVNRLWHHYFGTGLVTTNSDFGLRANSPSHPELLDYLASRLIENDWSLKSIHRLIVTSAVFRQTAGTPQASDPENRFLTVYPRRRLDFESMRDALLTASSEIDLRSGGAPEPLFGDGATRRRSIYGKIDRQFLPSELRVFDFANPELHSPRRYETNVPQQALFFLNSLFSLQRAKALISALRETSSENRVRELFRRVYQRDPTPDQLADSLEFIQSSKPDENTETLTPWERLAHALLLSNEFMFID